MFEKNEDLLSSMALRYNHGFGLMDKEEQTNLLEKMSDFYDDFKNNNIEKLNQLYGDVTTLQLSEEIKGDGFYNIKNKEYYNTIRKKI